MECCGSPSLELTEAVQQEIDHWVAKYPEGKRASAVMGALTAAQTFQGNGSLTPDLISAVANYLKIPPISALEVATFYSMYALKPVGKHHICICTNVPCKLKGSNHIVRHLKEKLGIGFGEVTPDGQFSLKEVECMGACVHAPMFQVGEDYHENLTLEKVDHILETLKKSGEHDGQ